MASDDPSADRAAITDQLHRYCRAVDRLDHALGYDVWHADGTADYGADTYRGSGRGFIDFVIEQHRRTLATSHQVTNIVLELDGDRAASESYHIAALRIARDGQPHEITVRGRYLDRWSRRDGRWAIDHRLTIRDFDDIRAVTPLGQATLARRDRDDPSYVILHALKEPHA